MGTDLAYYRQPFRRPTLVHAAVATSCRHRSGRIVSDGYDMAHLVTYLQLLDADGAEWQEVAAILLELDVAKDPKRAKRSWASHLARAKWMTESGYRYLLRGGPPN
jgi:hypothetical protein